MLIRVSKRKLFTTIILFNILFSRDDLISQLDTIGEQRSYFSMNLSPDKANIVLTNSNYTTLEIVCKDGINKVNLPDLNSFNCKWSPDSKKILIATATYVDKKRTNGLMVLDKYGTLIKTVIKKANEHIFPLGWTGNDTFHFMLNGKLVSSNVNQMEIEWDTPLVYSKSNKLFIKDDEVGDSLLFKADDMILNLSYLPNAEVISFEVYGHASVIIKNKRNIIKDLKGANHLSISDSGNKVIFSQIKDNGHTLTSGNLFVRDMRDGSIYSIPNPNNEIQLNPVWISEDLIYYIDFQTGLLRSISIKD